ncbi:DUF5793 family protein [Halapricum desulfuricans]|uniref:Uncharacterized protein n=1 Tax=Halapricum desulfuricans TaxID=2841257 RepID=A0A897N267_9EURY|nr:DUF5793 family protein [Halapricum desulfuricans]QSG05189.1 Uncharacterized protein HSR121_0837 [Halapricum desulfuricans]
MRREEFTTTVDTDDRIPRLTVQFAGTPETLRDRLAEYGQPLDVSDLDVSYRHTSTDEPGVLSVSHRLTGEFAFEAPLEPSALRSLVAATSRREEGDRNYCLRVEPGDGDPVEFEKETLLVYDEDGNLDREHSLIPGGVEL